MSAASQIALRKAVRDVLAASAPLTARLGGAHVYDEAPRSRPTPYVVISQGESRDWSTMTDKGAEHLLTLDVWSDQPGAREALAVAGDVTSILHEAALPIAGARCIHARVTSVETTRQNANRHVRARIRLRVLLEID